MPLPKTHIPIDKEIAEFRAYLESTDRAILSAKFGDGKSTFLEEFARKQRKYAVITINPLHYQVADNKDIFEYIKRDILIQMLSYIELEETVYSNSLLIAGYITNNGLDILEDIIDSAPDVDLGDINTELIKNPLRNLIKNIKKFKEYKEKIHEKTDNQIVKKFISSFDNYKGSIYEFDAVSQLICDINAQIKQKTILVIEDLDRIDPAHIFRILNILSAHIDRQQQGLIELSTTKGSNKFLFDKILLVCHMENIQSIFHHFYGADTDFRGYISKFSSHEPFHFSLKDRYKEYILDRFDKDLLQYREVATIVAEMIAENELKHTSLRDIRRLLTDKYPTIKQTTITIDTDNGDGTIKISSLNNLTKLLDLLNRFSISFDKLLIKCVAEKDNEDLYRLIGACWLLPVESDIHITYHAKEGKLYIQKDSCGIYRSAETKITTRSGVAVDIEFSFGVLNQDLNGKKLISNLPLIVEKMSRYLLSSKPRIEAKSAKK